MKALDALLKQMIEKGASDLHLVVGRPPLFRLRGDLVDASPDVLTPERAREVISEILTAEQQKQVQENLDLDFAYDLPDGEARFRANVLWQYRGMGAVLRIIPTKLMTVEQLG